MGKIKSLFKRKIQEKSAADIRSLYATSRRTFSYLANYRKWFVLAVFMMLVRCGSDILFNLLNKPLMNSLIEKEGISKLLQIVIAMIILAILSPLSHLLTNRILVRLSIAVTKRMRIQLCEHFHRLPMSYFNGHSVGEIMSVFSNDVDAVDQVLSDNIATMIESLILIVGIAIAMLFLSPIMTLFVWLIMIFSIIFSHLTAKFSVIYYRQRQSNLAKLNSYVEEMITGQEVIKTNNYQRRSIDKFSGLNEEMRKIDTKAVTIPFIVRWVTNYLSYFYFAIIAFIGFYFVNQQMFGIDFGTVIAILQLTKAFLRPMSLISTQMVVMIQGIAGAERIFKVFDEDLEQDQGQVKSIELADGKRFWLVPRSVDIQKNGSVPDAEIDKLVRELYPALVSKGYSVIPAYGELCFTEVDFSYQPHKPILKQISLEAKPNQRLALVGTTGSGKTTLVNLINRFYEVQGGSILIDGIDIRKIEKYHLRQNIGMVTQNIHHFAGTIRDNIRFGNLEATEDEVVAAAKLANAHSFIERLPGGYDFEMSVDGNNLSQGERQLIAIARVALINPLILILDEATSSVDTRTEQLIAQGMDKLMNDKTVIAIAHRLSTVHSSNAILIMEDGEIIESGTHEELLALRGHYFALATGRSKLT